MGKDLRGKELGVGISQREDGLYTARFTDHTGKRRQKYFRKLQECRNWLADAQFEDEHGNVLHCENPTVNAWFWYWLNNVKGDNIRYNTRKSYEARYKANIEPIIGDMLLKEIKPIHCQNVLNQMANSYTNGVIKHARIVMYSMFDCALDNDIILKNPVKKSVKCTAGKEEKKTKSLTIDEQKAFLAAVKNGTNYNQYAFILQTGIRTGELIGLKWSDVDFKRRVVHIRRKMEFRGSIWVTEKPKTDNSIRDIPLTQEAIDILKRQKEKLSQMKVMQLDFADQVFLCRKGTPIKNASYDTDIRRYCEKAGIEFFSMHTLRHTFATRCVEAGMKPKTLQMLLGHSKISTTMDLYVHLTEDEKFKEVEDVEKMLKLV